MSVNTKRVFYVKYLADPVYAEILGRRGLIYTLAITTLLILAGGGCLSIIEPETVKGGFGDGIWWAVVTASTVGYGDIAPATPLGKMLASVVMLMGYGILAVPTGIVTVELQKAARAPVSAQACPACGRDGHDSDAVHCKYCGAAI